MCPKKIFQTPTSTIIHLDLTSPQREQDLWKPQPLQAFKSTPNSNPERLISLPRGKGDTNPSSTHTTPYHEPANFKLIREIVKLRGLLIAGMPVWRWINLVFL